MLSLVEHQKSFKTSRPGHEILVIVAHAQSKDVVHASINVHTLCMQAAKGLARLHRRADSYEPRLLDNANKYKNLMCWLVYFKQSSERKSIYYC